MFSEGLTVWLLAIMAATVLKNQVQMKNLMILVMIFQQTNPVQERKVLKA